MKTAIIALALATAGLVAVPLSAHAQGPDKGGFFLNGSVGQANVDDGLYDDDDTAFGANFGYRWSVGPGAAFGIEGGYQNLGEWSPKASRVPSGTLAGKAEVKGWTAGVNGHFNVSDNWYISGRAGLFRADVTGDYLAAGVPAYVNDTSNKWYAGAGFGYDFSNNLSVGLAWDHYEVDRKNLDLNTDVISVTGEVRF
ncbi:MAG TPA: outer membrane beta-barrel protein [Dokdonella sp.]|uniref:outer membrane protein n=1 Tax=Dokdonella sp. TaxID=2291710 RepID=UPI0025C10A1F|nr:outer membrane beta-barrel protein [Dokdonella sp.]MBX3690718.1 porin family protein [Dokdonella sp.]MCW5566861.1 porin family protein [Dokdonella sp.]HNR91197.1 outer membrane beta-barrel protein [Dokdonella sp.]